MRSAVDVWLILAISCLTVIVLTLAGCGDDKQTGAQTASDTGNVVSRPNRSVSKEDTTGIYLARSQALARYISGMQQVLITAGLPFTDKQLERITNIPVNGSVDLRPIYGVLTHEQKRVFMVLYREKLADTDHPLTESQESQLLSYGPESEPGHILTSEQARIWFGM